MSEFNFWFLAWGMWFMYRTTNSLEDFIRLFILGICAYKMGSTW